MSFLTALFGVDKVVENQNRRIRLLGEELDSLRNYVETALETKVEVGIDDEGGKPEESD